MWQEFGRRRALLLVIALLTGVYGSGIFLWEWPPHDRFREKKEEEEPIDPRFLQTPPEYRLTDVENLIAIRTAEDAASKRAELVSLIFGSPGLPAGKPAIINRDYVDARYDDLAALQRIDRFTVEMDFSLVSRVYHFHPAAPENKLVLYHQGHMVDFYRGKETIRELLAHGFDVVAFCMPLKGLNNQPAVDVPHIGRLKLTGHDQMAFLTPEKGHPMQYLLAPVVIVLNHLTSERTYESISMLGISGGGWTTTLMAAIDERIRYSFPVAGSYTIYLRSNSKRDWGDYEQTAPDIYTRVNYPGDLYSGRMGQGPQADSGNQPVRSGVFRRHKVANLRPDRQGTSRSSHVRFIRLVHG